VRTCAYSGILVFDRLCSKRFSVHVLYTSSAEITFCLIRHGCTLSVQGKCRQIHRSSLHTISDVGSHVDETSVPLWRCDHDERDGVNAVEGGVGVYPIVF